MLLDLFVPRGYISNVSMSKDGIANGPLPGRRLAELVAPEI
jgi:hypothetical protein